MDGFTIWFTGIPSSGKTTLAKMLACELKKRQFRVEHLDDDILMEKFYSGLAYCGEDRHIEDRHIYIKRIAFICNLLARNNIISIVSVNSNNREIRNNNRGLIGKYIEIYTKCPIETCILRDPKGLFKKALTGEIKNLCGISDTYEEPFFPEIAIDTEKETVDASIYTILSYLESNSYISKITTPSPEEFEKFYA